MQKIQLIFGRSHTPASAAIRLFTWSRWSHVGIIDGDVVIESKGFKGVVVTPLEEFKARYNTWEIAYAPVHNLSFAYRLLYKEVGKKYDWSAIFGIFLRSGWDNPEKWVCSELYAHISKIVRHDRISRFTPEDVWKISTKKPAI